MSTPVKLSEVFKHESSNFNSSVDLDTKLESIRAVCDGCINMPVNEIGLIEIVHDTETNYTFQTFTSASRKTYKRVHNGTSWTSGWYVPLYSFETATNANNLGGVAASDYARKSTINTWSLSQVFSQKSSYDISSGTAIYFDGYSDGIGVNPSYGIYIQGNSGYLYGDGHVFRGGAHHTLASLSETQSWTGTNTFTGVTAIENDWPYLIFKDTNSTGDGVIGYTSYLDKNGTVVGQLGYISTSNSHFYVHNAHGNVSISSSGTERVLVANSTTTIRNKLVVEGDIGMAMLSDLATSTPDTTGDGSGFSVRHLNSTGVDSIGGVMSSVVDVSVMTSSFSSLWQTQIMGDWRNNVFYTRTQNNGTWLAAKRLANLTDSQTWGGTQYFGDLRVENTTPILRIRDTNNGAGATMTGWISFQDKDYAERGYVGYGSSGNTDFMIRNTDGVVRVMPRVSVTIGANPSNLNNSWFLIGDSSDGIGFDGNEITKLGGDLFISAPTSNAIHFRRGSDTALSLSGSWATFDKPINATSTTGSKIYGLEMSRSNTGTSTPDIWGTSNTLVFGSTASKAELSLTNNKVNIQNFRVTGDYVTVHGDADTFYPVEFITGTGQQFMDDIEISRNYSDTAPSTWYSSTHKGGLVFKLSVNFGSWGGVGYGTTVHDFRETYSNMVGAMGHYGNSTRFCVWLRGGGASYRIKTSCRYNIRDGVNYPATTHDPNNNGNSVSPLALADRDISNITNNLHKSGHDGTAVRYTVRGDGDVSTPSYRWANDGDTGFYRKATGEIGVALDGVNRLTFGRSASTSYGLNMHSRIHMGNSDIHYANEVHFNSDVRFRNSASSILQLRFGHTTTGNLQFREQGDDTYKGSVFFDDSGFGLLDKDGQWAFRADGTRTYNYYDNKERFRTSSVGGEIVGTTTGNGNYAYLSFLQSDATRDGYVGVGSGSNRNVYLVADSGQAFISSSLSSAVVNGKTGVDVRYNGTTKFSVQSDQVTIADKVSCNGTFTSSNAFTFLNGGSAQQIRTGSVLASSSYSDSAYVPSNGIYAKGVIKTYNQFQTGKYGDSTASQQNMLLLGYDEGWNYIRFASGRTAADNLCDIAYHPLATSGAPAKSLHFRPNPTGDSEMYVADGEVGISVPLKVKNNDVTLGGGSSYNPWLTLYGADNGTSPAERCGISIGESGKHGSASLHIYYTGDGYGHIGMGTMSSTTHAAKRAIQLYYTSSDVTFLGSITANGNVTAYSDRRLKTDIKRIDHALDKVKSLGGYTFNRTDSEDGLKQTGVIAQEVLEVLPEAVTRDDTGEYYSVAYGNMVGLLIESIKEESEQREKEIQDLKDKVEKLTNFIEKYIGEV